MCLVVESALANGGISRHDPSSSLKTICVVELLGCFASFGKHRPGLAAQSQVSRMNLEQSPYGATTADLWELTHHESIGVSSSMVLGSVARESSPVSPASLTCDLYPWPFSISVWSLTPCYRIVSLIFSPLPGAPITSSWKGPCVNFLFSGWRTVHYYS